MKMNESKEQIVQKYYEQFKANEWANYLIPKLNPKSVNDENISIILDSNIKKAPLKSLTSFLKKTFTKKYPTAVKHIVVKPQTSKSEIAYQIVRFVDLSHPYSNNYVNKEHIVNEVQKDNENTTKYDEDSQGFPPGGSNGGSGGSKNYLTPHLSFLTPHEKKF